MLADKNITTTNTCYEKKEGKYNSWKNKINVCDKIAFWQTGTKLFPHKINLFLVKSKRFRDKDA